MPKRARVPVLLQMERTECGAACLAMVLAGVGRWLPIDHVRERCGSARDGVSLAGIVRAARAEGLDANAFRQEMNDLGALPMPQILFWQFDHFVVLEAVTRKGFRIVDPAQGRRLVPRAEFSRAFTGITVTVRPTAAFEPSPRPPGVLRQLATVLRSSPGGVAALIATTCATILIGVGVPGLSRVFIDDYLVQGHRSWLIPLICAMAGLGFLRVFATALQAHVLLVLQAKINGMLSSAFVWRLLHLPLEFIGRRSAGDVAGRGQYAGQVAGVAAGPLAMSAANVIAVVVYLGVMLALDPVLTAAVLPIAAAQAVALRIASRSMRETAHRSQMASGLAHAASIQGVALLEQHRATGTEGVLFDRLLHAQVMMLNAEQEAGRIARLVGALPFLNGRLLNLTVLGVGALQVVLTDMTLGTLAAFTMLAELFAAALGALNGVGTSLGSTAGALGRLGDVLDQPAPAAGRPGREEDAGWVRLHNLGFAYRGGPALIDGVALVVEPGEFVAITGTSGSGKTTLAQLVAGLLPSGDGQVRAGRQLGYVDQNPVLPGGTLRAAITMWDPDMPDERIWRALADAEATGFVEARPGGLDSRIADSGIDYSGGEQQRLAMARALANEPDLLVLDDATSALDERTEAQLFGHLRRRGLTLLLFTNRTTALAQMDRVLVLHNGSLVDPHADALAPVRPEMVGV